MSGAEMFEAPARPAGHWRRRLEAIQVGLLSRNTAEREAARRELTAMCSDADRCRWLRGCVAGLKREVVKRDLEISRLTARAGSEVET